MTVISERIDRCRICAIRHQAVCGALSNDEIQALSAVARQRILKAGDVIQNAEDEVSSFANIVSGVVKLSKVLSDGRQQTVSLQFPPDFLGRAYRTRSPFYAEAATDVELCVFPKRSFEALMADQPELESRLFQNTLDELDAARDWMLLLTAGYNIIAVPIAIAGFASPLSAAIAMSTSSLLVTGNALWLNWVSKRSNNTKPEPARMEASA
jgi:CRP/FNR family transcriptional regulator, anaerobic regulatory protein